LPSERRASTAEGWRKSPFAQGAGRASMAFAKYKLVSVLNDKHGQLSRGDALGFLRTLDDGTADVVFLDPPFNLGKHYSKQDRKLDRRPEADYERWLRRVLLESSRILKPGGIMFLYHLPVWAMRMGAALDKDGEIQFFHWVAISMKNGFVRGEHLYPAHYALLMFSKGKPSHFRRPKLSPSRCRHCGGYIKDYGGYRAIIDKKGLNLSDVWEDLSPVRHTSTKNRAANELPQRLFDRVFAMAGKRGGVYVDPFSGSGTGVVSAVKAGMKYRACDLLRDNCLLLARRLSKTG